MSIVGICQERDLYSDTWVATDALGRTLPDYDDVGGLRADRTVGMFYFLWHGRHGSSTVYDNTQILQANPTNPQYGPVHSFHWWGEPEAGYYLATDPWVIRRNASMLVDAGVDFIYIDVTNAYTYEAEYTALCNVYQQIRSEGGKTPKIAFLTHKNSVATTQKLYDDFYSKDLFSELWFEWDGKPLMLSDLSGHSAEVQNFFTLRYSWAWDAGYDKWQWIDSYPQNYGWHDSSQTPEQIPAAVASHPTSNVGTSYSGGVQPAIDQYGLTATTGQGQHFAEQMQWAVQSDPEVLMVTGWNEWVAQRFLSDGFNRFLGEILPAGETFFVDAYNEEYNRDIEPMKGAHTDNYYYQLVDYIRQYKGVSAPQSPASPQSMTIDGNFAEWGNVGLEFRDTFGDTAHRSWAGWGGNYYTNTTGRNDIITSKVSVDEDNVYFYVETDAAITPSTDSNWMMLFIDADLDSTTGWNGYEFVVNQSVVDGDTSTVRQITAAGVWNTMGEVDYRVAGNKMEISIPRNLIGQVDAEIAMNFHWADNMQSLNDIAEFFINGDSAPNRRFDYHYANTVQTSLRNERDIAVFRPSSGQWFGSHTDPSQGHLSGTVTTQAGPLGGWEATPLVGDVNGDGLDDIVVVEAGGDNFNWTAGHTAYVAGGAGQFSSSKTSTLGSFAAVGGSQTVFLGDVNGDGADDAISVDATFNWSASLSTPGVGLGGGIQQGPVLFGKNDCVPLTGDFNGDNLLDIAYWKAAATGDGDPEDYYDFFIRLTTSSGLGTGAELVGEFGDVGDVPLLGDINGDGRDDVIIIYESNGELNWSVAYADQTGLIDSNFGGGVSNSVAFGSSADTPVVADINGDGRADIGYIHSDGGALTWTFAFSTIGGDLTDSVDASAAFGWTGDVPLFGQFNTSEQIPGDFNLDGVVDVSDLGILATYYGTASGMSWEHGDANNDSAVDVSDLGILASYFGMGSELVSVPEPAATALLLVLGAYGIATRRRRAAF